MRRSLQRGAGAASPTDGQALESVRFEMRDSEGLTIKVSVQRSWLNRRFARELSAVFTRAYNKRRGAGEGPLEASRVHLESPLGWLVSHRQRRFERTCANGCTTPAAAASVTDIPT